MTYVCANNPLKRDGQTRPICRQVTPVAANGMAGLQPAFHLNYLLENVEKHKKVPADPEVSANPQESISPDEMKLFCPEHKGKEVVHGALL